MLCLLRKCFAKVIDSLSVASKKKYFKFFFKLPVVLQGQIASFIGAEDLLNLRLISKAANHLFLQRLQYYKKFTRLKNLAVKTNNILIGLSVGSKHNVAVLQNDLGEQSIYSWGVNERGQLGVGHKEPVKPGFAIVRVIAGISSNIMLIANNYGVTEVFQNPIPLLCRANDGAANISSKGMHYIFKEQFIDLKIIHNKNTNYSFILGVNLQGMQSLYAWGANSSGQLGVKDDFDKYCPTEVSYFKENNLKIIKIKMGRSHTIALTENLNGLKQIYAWGNNNSGQLGLGHNHSCNVPTYVPVDLLDNFEIIEVYSNKNAEHNFLLARSKIGAEFLYAWGGNDCGQLGFGNIDDCNVPRLLYWFALTDTSLIQLVLGCVHSFALLKYKSGAEVLYGWGHNDKGQLGLGHIDECWVPTMIDLPFSDDFKITKILATSWQHTFIIIKNKDDKYKIYGWGSNEEHLLGTPFNMVYYKPVEVELNLPPKCKVITLVMGSYHGFIWIENEAGEQQLYGWGNNQKNQLGIGFNAFQNTPHPFYFFTHGRALYKLIDKYFPFEQACRPLLSQYEHSIGNKMEKLDNKVICKKYYNTM